MVCTPSAELRPNAVCSVLDFRINQSSPERKDFPLSVSIGKRVHIHTWRMCMEKEEKVGTNLLSQLIKLNLFYLFCKLDCDFRFLHFHFDLGFYLDFHFCSDFHFKSHFHSDFDFHFYLHFDFHFYFNFLTLIFSVKVTSKTK